ncbi:hypothetical protein FS799_07155 [Agrobacterium vitis]|nr:hypothetical protein [Agrobacterium vitis]MUO73013.1 hypothetical protein [Agrobacterium vitis]MUO86806.1 hypothetical protein [Agrobacterium vitis]MVA35322.1 hypothetical protein [Agrobacterium vitis]
MHKDTESALGYSHEEQMDQKKAELSRNNLPDPYDEELAGAPDRDSMMYAPRVFAGMAVVLLGFAIYNYQSTGLLAAAIIRTVVAAIILQSVYFIAIVYLVMRRVRARLAALQNSQASRVGGTRMDECAGCDLTLAERVDNA